MEEDGAPNRKVISLPPTKDNTLFQNHPSSPAPGDGVPGPQPPYPNALEAAQALVAHHTARLEGPEARDVVAQVVQLQLWETRGLRRAGPAPPTCSHLGISLAPPPPSATPKGAGMRLYLGRALESMFALWGPRSCSVGGRREDSHSGAPPSPGLLETCEMQVPGPCPSTDSNQAALGWGWKILICDMLPLHVTLNVIEDHTQRNVLRARARFPRGRSVPQPLP